MVPSSGYVTEVEVKVSLTDLRRDAEKEKWRTRSFVGLITRFYYAMPLALWQREGAQEAVREGAGVITVERVGRRLKARLAREAERRPGRKLSLQERFTLARVGSYRAWSPQQRHRLRQLEAERDFDKRHWGFELEKLMKKYGKES